MDSAFSSITYQNVYNFTIFDIITGISDPTERTYDIDRLYFKNDITVKVEM